MNAYQEQQPSPELIELLSSASLTETPQQSLLSQQEQEKHIQLKTNLEKLYNEVATDDRAAHFLKDSSTCGVNTPAFCKQFIKNSWDFMFPEFQLNTHHICPVSLI